MEGDFRKNSIISNNLKYFIEYKNKSKFENFIKHWDKYVYSFSILVMYFNYGLVVNIFPAAMVDMKYLFHTSINLINYVNTFNSLGFLLGSLCGFLYAYINRQLTFVVLTAALGVFTAVMPFCTNLWQVYLCAILAQTGAGVFESGNTIWVVEMWKENSAPVLQLTKAFFGVGSIAAPLLAKPYLFGELVVNNATDFIQIGNSTKIMTMDQLNDSIDRKPYVKMPFIFAGAVTLSVPILLLIMFVLKRYKEPGAEVRQKLSQQLERMPTKIQTIGDSNKLLIEKSPKLKWTLIGLTSISLSTIGGFEFLHFYYCSTYIQFLPIRLSVQKAADIMSLMATTYTVAKLVSALIAIKVKAEIMIIYHFVILCISMGILYFGQNTELMIWIGNGLIGIGFSAVWPAYFSFAEQYIGLTNKISSIFSFSSAICSMITPFILGPLIEKYPDIFLITEFAYISITIALFMVLLFIAKRSSRSPDIYTVNY